MDVAALEDLTLTAWPCLRTIHHDGWVLRFAAGHTGRANSVNALHPGRSPLAEKVDFAEAAYRAQGLDTMFRITPLSPPGLEAELDRRGYGIENHSAVQLLQDLPETAPDPAVTLVGAPSSRWTDAYARMTGLKPERRTALAGILSAIAPTALYGAAEIDGRIASVALGVVDRGHVGIFDVATDPDFRGRGLAGRVIAAILSRARTLGAGSAYLQVARINTPALTLYARLGFREVYGYHYRRLAL